MRRQLVLATATIAMLSGAICAEDATAPVAAPAPADAPAAAAAPTPAPAAEPAVSAAPAEGFTYTEGGMFKKFYGEVVFEGRLYIFGTQPAMDKFLKTKEFDITHSKTHIGAGPGRMTVRAQVDADAPTLEPRIFAQMKRHYSL